MKTSRTSAPAQSSFLPPAERPRGRSPDENVDGAATDEAPPDAPLAVRMRPRTLDEFVGQAHILGPGKPLRRAIEDDRLSSIVLWGPPGTGKTTLALLMARRTRAHFASLSAVTDGVADLRRVIEDARARRRAGQRTILLVDEVHRWSKSQQDALLPYVENGTVILVGATTENPYFDVVAPLRSRVRIFRLEPLGDDDVGALVERAVHDPERGLGGENVSLEPAGRAQIVSMSGGDARIALGALESAAHAAAPDASGARTITPETVVEATQRRQVRYDKQGDDHYQTISAFIKSLRGSDPDAAVFYLAKMLAVGEDPRFIARRMVILASEDVGNADPQGLIVATAAAEAVERIGMPEAGLTLAQSATYLATAPKSNRAAAALWSAQAAIEAGANTEVPLHLRNASFGGAQALGYGRGYKYAHDFEGAHAAQRHLPDGVDQRFYEPGDQGYERQISERLKRWREDVASAATDPSAPGNVSSSPPEA